MSYFDLNRAILHVLDNMPDLIILFQDIYLKNYILFLVHTALSERNIHKVYHCLTLISGGGIVRKWTLVVTICAIQSMYSYNTFQFWAVSGTNITCFIIKMKLRSKIRHIQKNMKYIPNNFFTMNLQFSKTIPYYYTELQF